MLSWKKHLRHFHIHSLAGSLRNWSVTEWAGKRRTCLLLHAPLPCGDWRNGMGMRMRRGCCGGGGRTSGCLACPMSWSARWRRRRRLRRCSLKRPADSAGAGGRLVERLVGVRQMPACYCCRRSCLIDELLLLRRRLLLPLMSRHTRKSTGTRRTLRKRYDCR